MKKVLHVLSSLQRSGMEMMLLCSYDEWLREGYQCDVLATTVDIGPLAPALQEAGYGVHHLPFRGGKHYLTGLDLHREYFRLCANYDVVHIHVEAATPMFAGLAQLANVRTIVLTPHNTFRFHGFLRVRKYLERSLLRGMGCRYGLISEDVKACEWEFYRNPGVRTWNWFNTKQYLPRTHEQRLNARQQLEISPEAFVLVSVGNCNEAKNHEAILNAIPKLQQGQPLYLHIGKEPPEQGERRLAAELGLGARVRFIGSQPDPRLYLHAADAFLMPSRWEGLPLSAIEAVAVGLPAIFAEVSGLREIAAEMQYPTLTGTDADAVAKGIDEVASLDAEEGWRRAEVDSERIRGRFSIENGVGSIVHGLYEQNPAVAE